MMIKCISAGSFCLGLERKHVYMFFTYLCHTYIFLLFPQVRRLITESVSVCILMYWAVHKSKMFLFYLQDVHRFIFSIGRQKTPVMILALQLK